MGNCSVDMIRGPGDFGHHLPRQNSQMCNCGSSSASVPGDSDQETSVAGLGPVLPQVRLLENPGPAGFGV